MPEGHGDLKARPATASSLLKTTMNMKRTPLSLTTLVLLLASVAALQAGTLPDDIRLKPLKIGRPDVSPGRRASCRRGRHPPGTDAA